MKWFFRALLVLLGYIIASWGIQWYDGTNLTAYQSFVVLWLLYIGYDVLDG